MYPMRSGGSQQRGAGVFNRVSPTDNGIDFVCLFFRGESLERAVSGFPVSLYGVRSSNASAKLRLLGDDSGLCRAPSVPVIH